MKITMLYKIYIQKNILKSNWKRSIGSVAEIHVASQAQYGGSLKVSIANTSFEIYLHSQSLV